MKVSDIMLDMATGDATIHDVYIQEAVGKIAVSSAYFETALKINELAVAGGEFAFIQEAADAHLPTDAGNSYALACEAVKQQLQAFYTLLIETSKKVKFGCDKDVKLLFTLGKKYGISYDNSSDFYETFANPLAAAIMAGNRRLSLKSATFLKSKASDKITSKYGRGMGNFISAYGLSTEDVYTDPVITKFFGKKLEKCSPATTIDAIHAHLDDGGDMIKFDKILDKSRFYTAEVSENDIATLITGVYITYVISKSIADMGTSATSKTVASNINEICDKSSSEVTRFSEKKISRTISNIGSSMNEWTSDVTALSDNITKAFTDSVYSLMEAVN